MSISICVAYLDPINVSDEVFEEISDKVIAEAYDEVSSWEPPAHDDAKFEERLNEHLGEVYAAQVRARMERAWK